jgi:membrane associated rhomboid family serine protease
MRYQFGFHSPSTNVTWLLIALIGSYLLLALFGHSYAGSYIYSKSVLNPYLVAHNFEIWRLISYAFIHDLSSPFHVIFNALLLYMIGPQLEERWGEKRFLIFIFAAILSGALFVLASYLLGLSHSVVLGFSAAGMALLIAWGLSYPRQQIYVFGILPLTGIQSVYATIGLEIVFSVSDSSISSAAHFGGIACALIFCLGLYRPRRWKEMWRQLKYKKLSKK